MFGGVFLSKFIADEAEGVLHHECTQPTEDLIFARNQELKKNQDLMRDLGKGTETMGRHIANIPFITYEWALREGYDLRSPDRKIRSAEMFRFLNSEVGKKCMIRDHT